MRKILSFGESVFVVVSLLLLSGGPLALVLSEGASQGDGREGLSSSVLLQLVYLTIYFVTFLLLLKHWRQVLNLLISEKFTFLLVGVAIVSVLWSYEPTITLRRSIALSGTTLFGLYLAIRYSISHQLRLLGWTLGIAISLCFLFVLFFPQYGIMGGYVHDGIWRGIYTHKNVLGKVMSLSLFVFLLLAANSRNNRFLLWCGFSFSLILLIFSTSKSSLGVCAVLLTLLGVYWLWQKRHSITIPILIALVMISVSLSAQVIANFYVPVALSEALSSTFNTNSSSRNSELSNNQLPPKNSSTQATPKLKANSRNSELSTNQSPSKNSSTQAKTQKRRETESVVLSDDLSTLTGRRPMWASLMKMIQKRPLLGYGYSAFWYGPNSPSAEVWLDTQPWKPENAHNGLLETWADLGLLGVTIFLVGFLSNLLRAFIWFRQTSAAFALWPLVYFTLMVLWNVTTSTILEQNNIFWLLYVAVVFSMIVSQRSKQLLKEN